MECHYITLFVIGLWFKALGMHSRMPSLDNRRNAIVMWGENWWPTQWGSDDRGDRYAVTTQAELRRLTALYFLRWMKPLQNRWIIMALVFILKNRLLWYHPLIALWSVSICLVKTLSLSCSRNRSWASFEYKRVVICEINLSNPYLEEDFRFAQLVVDPTQDGRTDPLCDGPAIGHLMGGSDPRQQKTISVDELHERVSYRITGSSDANSFHHSWIPELFATQIAVEHLKRANNPRITFTSGVIVIPLITNHWFFGLIWFNTANEERMTLTKLSHQRVQWLLELSTKSGRLFAGVVALKKDQKNDDNYRTNKALPVQEQWAEWPDHSLATDHSELMGEQTLQVLVLADLDQLD